MLYDQTSVHKTEGSKKLISGLCMWRYYKDLPVLCPSLGAHGEHS